MEYLARPLHEDGSEVLGTAGRISGEHESIVTFIRDDLTTHAKPGTRYLMYHRLDGQWEPVGRWPYDGPPHEGALYWRMNGRPGPRKRSGRELYLVAWHNVSDGTSYKLVRTYDEAADLAEEWASEIDTDYGEWVDVLRLDVSTSTAEVCLHLTEGDEGDEG